MDDLKMYGESVILDEKLKNIFFVAVLLKMR